MVLTLHSAKSIDGSNRQKYLTVILSQQLILQLSSRKSVGKKLLWCSKFLSFGIVTIVFPSAELTWVPLEVNCQLLFTSKYRGSSDSMSFAHPGNCTIEKVILTRDWFSTKIAIYDFWIFKVPFFSSFTFPFFSYLTQNACFFIYLLHIRTIKPWWTCFYVNL